MNKDVFVIIAIYSRFGWLNPEIDSPLKKFHHARKRMTLPKYFNIPNAMVVFMNCLR